MSSTAPKVDLRFLQANERTALAWVRTGLALMAFGFVVARLGLWLRQTSEATADRGQSQHSLWIGAGFIVFGIFCNLLASFRFVRIRRALVEGRPTVPGALTVVVVALAVAALGAALVAYLLR